MQTGKKQYTYNSVSLKENHLKIVRFKKYSKQIKEYMLLFKKKKEKVSSETWHISSKYIFICVWYIMKTVDYLSKSCY